MLRKTASGPFPLSYISSSPHFPFFCIYRISPAQFSVLSNAGSANVSKLLAFLKRSISDSKPSIRPSVCTIFGWKFCLQFPVAYSTHWFVFWFWTFQIEGNRFLVLFLLLGWIWKTQICPLQTLQVTNLPVPLVILISSSTLFWYKNNSAWSLAVARKFRKIRTKKSFCVCVCVCDYFFISCINLRDQDKAIMCVRGARLVDGGEGLAHDWPTLPIGHQSYLWYRSMLRSCKLHTLQCLHVFEQHDWLTMSRDPARLDSSLCICMPCQSGVWYYSKKFKHDGPQRFYRKRLPGWKAGTEIFISDFEW